MFGAFTPSHRIASMNPNASSFVLYNRIAVISIPDSATCKSLIRCILSLSNLHTLRISLHCSPSADLFSSVRFPQIRTLKITPCDARLFIPCCPKVRAVISIARISGRFSLRGLFDQSEKSLEELDGFTLSESDVECMVLTCFTVQSLTSSIQTLSKWLPTYTKSASSAGSRQLVQSSSLPLL
jgi:hypothetical protein